MKTGPSYLQGHRWLDLTREERYFCAELFQALKTPQNLKAFIGKINASMLANGRSIELDEHGPWEVGYEVAFYRDMVHALGFEGQHAIGGTDFSRKRTFDLCLFGADYLVVIEAKAHQGLKKKQLDEFLKDAEHIEQLTTLKKENILLVGLWSSRYSAKVAMSRKATVKDFHGKVNENFHGILHWNDLGFKGPDFDGTIDLFTAADGIYGRLGGELT